MKNVFWLTAIVLAFVAGYFTHSVTEAPAEATRVAPTVAVPIENSLTNTPVSSEQLSATAKAVFAEKQKLTVNPSQHQNSSEPTAGGAQAPQLASSSLAAEANDSGAKKHPNEISDEDIDKVLPAPFNQSLKNRHGGLREKYKDFAATNQQQDWDRNIQNKLTDAILSNPYAKFLNIESLQCKANLCEIRLYETKEGAWSLIMAEMRLQEWWDFGGTSASGFGTDTPSKMGWYVLFPRR